MLSVRKPLFIFGTRTRKASISETCWLLNVEQHCNCFSDKFVLVVWKLGIRKSSICIKRKFKGNFFFAGLIFLKCKISSVDDHQVSNTVNWN